MFAQPLRGSRVFHSKKDKSLCLPHVVKPVEEHYFSSAGKYPSIVAIKYSNFGNSPIFSKRYVPRKLIFCVIPPKRAIYRHGITVES